MTGAPTRQQFEQALHEAGLSATASELATRVVMALLSRSAAEPPEDHGVRLVHGPGCDECKQVGRVLAPAPRDDCSCWESGPELCRVHGVAEPNEELGEQLRDRAAPTGQENGE